MKVIYRRLCTIELALSATLLMVTVFTIFISAVIRALGTPINWALDIALLSFTWCAFLGADVAFRENNFVDIDLIYSKLPLRLQQVIDIVIYTLIFLFLSALVYYGTLLSISTCNRSFQGIPTLSYTWVPLSIPVSSLLMLITLGVEMNQKYFILGKSARV